MSSPLPVTTLTDNTLSAAVPLWPLPQNMQFCDKPPPTVAKRPESVPQKGVRTPKGVRCSWSFCQLQPTSTVT